MTSHTLVCHAASTRQGHDVTTDDIDHTQIGSRHCDRAVIDTAAAGHQRLGGDTCTQIQGCIEAVIAHVSPADRNDTRHGFVGANVLVCKGGLRAHGQVVTSHAVVCTRCKTDGCRRRAVIHLAIGRGRYGQCARRHVRNGSCRGVGLVVLRISASHTQAD